MPHAALDRRRLLTLLGAAGLCAIRGAHAQVIAAPALRILCGYPPGGPIDVVSRKIADKLTGRYAPAAIVENKSGAAGRIAMQELKRAPADGSSLLITPASVATMYPHVFRDLGYDVFADALPVSKVAVTAFAVAAGPRVPASVANIESFVRWCKSEPRQIQVGNAGLGSMPHFISLLLARETGVGLSAVPYRSGSAAMLAASTGELPAALATESAARPLVASGKLRVLATTGNERSPFFPGAPTLRESGWPALVIQEWFGAFMPPRTAPQTVNAMAGLLHASFAGSDIKSTWEALGLIPETSTPAQLRDDIRDEHTYWGNVVKAFGFTPES